MKIFYNKYEKDFTFIVNGKEYPTTRFLADLISPIILHYHFTDETIDKFYIYTSHPKGEHNFSEILSLINSDEIILTKDQFEYFIEIFIKLGNEKELHKLIPTNTSEITIDNVFINLQNEHNYIEQFYKASQKEPNYFNFEKEIRPEIDFISSHFSEIEKEKILNLDIQLFERIIKSDKLKLEDEDSLIKIINELYSQNKRLSYLYSYVNFLFVSQEELEQFHSIFDVNDMSCDVWNAIFDRVLKSQVLKEEIQKSNRQYKKKGLPLLLNGEEFNGIIKYLTNKTGGNIHDNGTIETTTNTYHGGNEPKFLLDFHYNNFYESNQANNAWVCFDFKDMKIKITNYSIKSNTNSPNGRNLRSWDLEVSNDGQKWEKIDERRNCKEINGSLLTATFSRYVRLHQTDTTWNGRNPWFYYIEFYGYLIE